MLQWLQVWDIELSVPGPSIGCGYSILIQIHCNHICNFLYMYKLLILWALPIAVLLIIILYFLQGGDNYKHSHWLSPTACSADWSPWYACVYIIICTCISASHHTIIITIASHYVDAASMHVLALRGQVNKATVAVWLYNDSPTEYTPYMHSYAMQAKCHHNNYKSTYQWALVVRCSQPPPRVSYT